MLIASAVDVSIFCFMCRNSTQVHNADKAFEVEIGCNATDIDLDEEALNSFSPENKPLCEMDIYFSSLIILVEIVKTIYTISKYYSQVKTKYLKKIKKNTEKVPGHHVQVKIKALPRRANSLPNMFSSSSLEPFIVKKPSLQTLQILPSKQVKKIKNPVLKILFKTFKLYIFRSNLFIVFLLSCLAIITLASINTYNSILQLGKIYSFFVPVFFFLTESKLRKEFKNQFMKVVYEKLKKCII